MEDTEKKAAYTVKNSRWRFLGTDSCDATLNSIIRGSTIVVTLNRGMGDEVKFLRDM